MNQKNVILTLFGFLKWADGISAFVLVQHVFSSIIVSLRETPRQVLVYCLQQRWWYKRMRKHTHTHKQAVTIRHTPKYAHMHLQLDTFTSMYLWSWIHRYTYTYMHPHTHIHKENKSNMLLHMLHRKLLLIVNILSNGQMSSHPVMWWNQQPL